MNKYTVFKHLLFKHYPAVAGVWSIGVVLLATVTIKTGWAPGWQVTLGAAGFMAGFVYFVQKQRLDEMKMLYDLFTRFNERYAKISSVLKSIVSGDDKIALTRRQQRVLNEYFNLCAEEFFFFKHGYVYLEVWQTWNEGMRWYCRKSNRIQSLWFEELSGNSYYGLTRQFLEDQNLLTKR